MHKKLCTLLGLLILMSKTLSSEADPIISDNTKNSTENNFSDMLFANMINIVLIVVTPLTLLNQLQKIWTAKSAKGISYSSAFLSTFVLIVHCGYNFHYGHPVMTWGECLIAQYGVLVIMFYIWYYEGKSETKSSGISKFEAFSTILFLNLFFLGFLLDIYPEFTYDLMYNSGTFIMISSKIMQLWETFRLKSVGDLAFIGPCLVVLGTLARLFTTIVQTPDFNMILSQVLALGFNVTSFAMFFIYPGNEKSKKD